jgi:hypothetical protein
MQQSSIRIAALWAGSVLLVGGCQSMSVRSDTAATTSVSACSTYAWMESATAERHSAFENPINYQRLKSAISQRLESHGIHAGQSGSADCLVSYATGTRILPEAEHRSRVGFGLGTGYGWGRSGFGSMLWDTGMPYEYRESRLSVDLFKASTREPIWHASVNTDISQMTGADAEKRIDTVVSAMFSKFPAIPR